MFTEEEQITAAFIAHDESGLESAYRLYGRLLYSIARSVLHNDEDAQDCVHDALVRVWQREGVFRPERGALRGFLGACVRNEAITRMRAAMRHARIEATVAHDVPLTYEFDASDVTERDALRRALVTLPAEQREVLALAYFAHLTHAETAERLGLPLGTVKGRLRLALAKLQSALNAKHS